MTRYERVTSASQRGIESPKRGPGRHSLVNTASRLLDMPSASQTQDAPINSINGNGHLPTENLVFSKPSHSIRRNNYDGRPTKPNRAVMTVKTR